MVALDERVWFASAADVPELVRMGVMRFIDLRVETKDAPAGVVAEPYPLHDGGTGQLTMLEALGRRVEIFVRQGERVGVFSETSGPSRGTAALAYLVRTGSSLSEAVERLRAIDPVHVPTSRVLGTVRDLEQFWKNVRLDHHYLRVRGVSLHAVHLPGPEKPIFLLHGAYGSFTHWWRNLAGLARTFDVWAVDLPGFGESDDISDPFSVEQYRALLNQAIRTWTGRLGILGGYSFGAYLALDLLQAHPDLARAGLLVGLGGRTGDPSRHRRVEEAHFPPDPSFQDRLGVVEQNLRAIHLSGDRPVDAFTVYLTYHNILRTRRGYGRLRGGSERTSVVDILRALSVPLLMVWGQEDPFSQPTPEDWARILKAANPHIETAVLPRAAHWCMYQEPEAFRREVQRFTEAVLPSDPACDVGSD